MTEIDRLVRDYYREAKLPAARVDAILAAAPRRSVPARVWYVRIAALAAALVVAFASLHLYLVGRDTEARVLAEIAMNHKERLEVEVTAADFPGLDAALDRLAIRIRPPASLTAGYDLIGGRYCSIQGSLAAQIKLRDPASAAVHTLYATALTPQLAQLSNHTTVHDGVRITLWHDSEVFYGLAADALPGAVD